ncbi:MAG: nicotinate-nicotinamide nucleotide adenylyltransferase [Bacteroidales bacterium]|nr:nicotinate-nicotinamide nucleotide adenylyltransferase [Bacteroidales bacterium]
MRCALYFGSFNPLHKGHVAIARYVMENCNVDRVRLVLSPQSPFKDNNVLQDPQKRLQDLQKSIARFNSEYTSPADASSLKQENKTLEISTVEFDLPRPNYTYNTLQHLKKIEPETTFLIVMGADNLAVIEKWYKGLEILQEFEVLVYPRTGYETEALCKKYGATYLNAPLNNISSTMIREGEKNGDDMSEFRY